VERLPYLAIALAGEIGELCNILKKDMRGDPGDRYDAMISEIADIGNYLHILCLHLDIDLHAEMLTKLIAVEQRPAWRARR
jgi:NTP pyrophosphatase (non-canonical NTP hydrolase)